MLSVSVIIPTYNRASLIGHTIENMLQQSHPPHELIVVDDGSEDGTPDVIRQFGNRVILLEQGNAGPGAARNLGLSRATGELIQFFDSDDLATLDKLELQARALEESGADIAYSAWIPAILENGRMEWDGWVRQQRPLCRNPVAAMMRNWLTLFQASMVRRSTLLRVGGYPTVKYTGEDIQLLFTLLLSGARLVHVAGPLIVLRQHSGQISSAAEHRLMRARDRAYLARTVWRDAVNSVKRQGSLERFLWRGERWNAVAELRQLQSPTRVGAPRAYRALKRSRQIAAGIRARTIGHRLPSEYGVARITDAQSKALADIGLALD